MRVAVVAVIGALVMSGDRTSGCADGEPGEVRWDLPAGPGESGVEWLGCADWGVELLGPYSATLEAGWSRCAVRAWRRDGQLRITSDPVNLTGGDQQLAFDLLEGPIGGMGASIRHLGSFVRVEEVLWGTPAELMGLQPGDRIVAVNGEATRHMSASAFIRSVTGRPGTVVDLELAGAGCHAQAERMQLVRERIPWPVGD